MFSFCLFAGTAEGRELAELLTGQGAAVTVCVATEYGETLLPRVERLTVRAGRLDREGMAELLRETEYDLVIDATHPYAVSVSENLSLACRETGKEYLRLLRGASARPEAARYFSDAGEVVAFLRRYGGKVLLTTGSKDLGTFAALPDFAERVYARVLPIDSSLRACQAAGLPPSHIIAMQGPFSRELNAALVRSVGATWLVTKDGGDAGGFPEKTQAARETGCGLLVIGRPRQGEGEGESLSELLARLQGQFGFRFPALVTLAGIGPGGADAMTREVLDACAGADCLIGAQRMISAVLRPGQHAHAAVAAADIAAYIRANPEYRRFTVALSGDTGFYSGAKKLLPLLSDCNCRVTVLPGLSSLSVLCARLGASYEDAETLSLHGREGSLVPAARRNRLLFVLTGGEKDPGAVCRELTAAGLGDLTVHVGERLGYPEEKITSGPAEELTAGEYDSLSAVLIENPGSLTPATPGLPDGSFLRREGVPMTKREIRALALCRLAPARDAVCWDVGAGTGSVSVELALLADRGRVYAVERDAEALGALEYNKARFGLGNLTVVPGSAPEALQSLPAPTHVFLGGTGGKIREILNLIREKNPRARIVAAAVTLETVAELTEAMDGLPPGETDAVCLNVSRAKKAGPYHLMTAGNPVYLFSFGPGEGEA